VATSASDSGIDSVQNAALPVTGVDVLIANIIAGYLDDRIYRLRLPFNILPSFRVCLVWEDLAPLMSSVWALYLNIEFHKAVKQRCFPV
jgi:hypothetical protein